MSDWIKIGERNETETFIRPWSPGDGLVCSQAGKQKRSPCGPPVASKMILYPRGTYVRHGEWREKRIHSVVCVSHLAGQFASSPGGERAEVERAAREQLIVAHWDEYQAAVAERFAEVRALRLAAIPEAIRDLIGDRIDADETDCEGDAS
ncbi:hypothetical protein G4X40_18740 [Rhodococcus sp. D2-41]|uniref:hypothetical protein n=1 Tax=Speluncibacter jeojiensis TaxID=2710754 RepID=UPI00240F3641|nr:hypothetical protein [Rhodococcus sp. D2-41]MDG3012182.1 hypothetical protein [Rhodococcus sp. D2-41]